MLQVRIYFLVDAVRCPKKGGRRQRVTYNVENMIGGIIRRGGTVPAGTNCSEARGLRADEVVEGTAFGAMSALALWTSASEGVAVL